MIVTAGISLGLAAVCLLNTAAMIIWSFDTLQSSRVEPAGLASGISTGMMSLFASLPLVLIGIVFLIVGFIGRQSVTNA